MKKTSLFLTLLFVTLVGCATDITVVRRGEPISPRDAIFVEFEFDEADLTPVFRNELKSAGFLVTETKSEAVYLFSGHYVALWDVIHYRLRFGQFKVTKIKTGEVVMFLECGPSRLESAESAVQKIIEDMVNRKK